jgi:hypothetical protein
MRARKSWSTVTERPAIPRNALILQVMWLLSEGKTSKEVSGVTGYSLGWMRKIARRYNERDLQDLAPAATGIPVRGRGRCSTRPDSSSFERRSCRGQRRLLWAGDVEQT